MGHIINPTLYRIGRVLPWVSSGFKRRKNDRTKIANEDFLIYNFTRNFFLKKVYKKVIGKIKKQKLNVRRKGRKVRKNKRKRKYGKKALLNNWIIRFSHLTIARFNKTFQLNLFFFDRELQKKYRLRVQRTKKQIKAFEKKQRFKKIKKYRKKIKFLRTKLKRVVKKKRMTTKILFDGSFNINKLGQKEPEQLSLSKKIAQDLSSIMVTPINAPMNLTVGLKFKPSKDILEKLTIYKDNTFESARIIKNRLSKSLDIDTSFYRQLFLARLKPKLFYKFYNKSFIVNKYIKPFVVKPDRFYFSKLKKKINFYAFTKYINKEYNTTFGNGFNSTLAYLDMVKKPVKLKSVKYDIKKNSGNLNLQVIKNIEKKIKHIHQFKLKNNMTKEVVLNKLKEKDMWKKHFIRVRSSVTDIYRKKLKNKRKQKYVREKKMRYKKLKLKIGKIKK